MSGTLRTTPPASRRTQPAISRTDRAPRIASLLNSTVHTVARHWLLLANAVMALYTALPILAPVLMARGFTQAAQFVHTCFRLFCHQLPERSFFLFGPQLTYTLGELERVIGSNVPLRYVGDPALGYKTAVCQRDLATYLATLFAGLVFALVRRRLRPLPVRAFVLLCAPMALDGFGQLLMLWDSTWWSRAGSGALFGAACVWLAYPYIEAGMTDVLHVIEKEMGKEADS